MATLTDLAKQLRSDDGQKLDSWEEQRTGGVRQRDSSAIVAAVYALLTAMGMIVLNPERTRDDSVPCPVQNMHYVAVVSGTAFLVAYVALSGTFED